MNAAVKNLKMPKLPQKGKPVPEAKVEAAPVKQSPAVKQAAPVKETKTAKESAPAKQSAPAKESAPAKQPAPAKETKTAKESAAAKQPAPAKQPPVVKESPAVKEAKSVKQPAPAKETKAAKESVAAKQPAPAKQAAPVKESAPAKQPTPAKESAPAKQPTPVKESRPVKESAPVKETKTAKESAPVKQPAPPKESRALKKSALGRDLAALLGEDVLGGDLGAATAAAGNIQEITVDKISPNPAQPRRSFKAESIQELAASIKEQGLMQPIILRPRQGTPDEYELVAGERRWRAAVKAGLATIPAILRDITDETSAALSLIENIQREDLNPYEEAMAMEELRVRYDYTQQQLADVLSKSRAAVANLLRLLKLEKEVKNLVAAGKLELGHAKVLLALEGREQVKMAEEAVENNLNVRELEILMKKQQSKRDRKSGTFTDANIVALQEELSDKLGVRVVFSHKRSGMGRMMIHYHSADELDGLLKILKLKKSGDN